MVDSKHEGCELKPTLLLFEAETMLLQLPNFSISEFMNSANFSITDVAKAITNTLIVSWNFDLGSRVIVRSISPLFRSSTYN